MLTKKQWVAIATLIGGTLGAGLFGVPYVFARTGVLRGTIRTLGIGLVTIFLNLLQAEISLSTPGNLPLSGIMKKLLPGNRSFIGIFAACMQFFIALFAYTSLAWGFLSLLIGPEYAFHPAVSASIYTIAIWLLLFRGINSIKKIDKIIVIIFVAMLLFLIIYGFSITTPSHFLASDSRYRFLPYGVLIYSLNSVSTIPLIEWLLDSEKKKLPRVIIIGWLICVAVVLLRGRSVVGISGAATSPDALSGLQTFIPNRLMKLSWLIGLFAITSPHLIIGEHFKETLQQAFRFRTTDARTTVVFLPLIAYLYIESDFVGTIGFWGAIFTGLICIFVGVMNLLLHAKHGKRESHILPYNRPISYLIIGVFTAWIIYECFKEFIL